MKKILLTFTLIFLTGHANAMDAWVITWTTIQPDFIHSEIVAYPQYHYKTQNECEKNLLPYLNNQGAVSKNIAGFIQIVEGSNQVGNGGNFKQMWKCSYLKINVEK